MSVQIKAALAVEVLADHNEISQSAFLAHDTDSALIRLLRVSANLQILKKRFIRLFFYFFNVFLL